MSIIDIFNRFLDVFEGPLFGAGILATHICLFFVVCVAGMLAWRRVRWLRARRSFGELSFARGFTADETASLWQIARFAPSGKPDAVVEYYDEFRRSVEMARSAAGDDPEAWPVHLHNTIVRPLRRKVMTPERSRFQISRTSEIEQNQPCSVRLDDGEEFFSFVTHVTSEDFLVALPDNTALWDSIRPGADIQVTFWRARDARYEVSSRITDAAFGSIYIVHAGLQRMQNRKHVRVRYRGPVRIAMLEKTTSNERRDQPRARALEVALVDISASGAALVCNESLPEGKPMMLQVELPMQPGRIRVPGRVLRQSLVTGGFKPAHRTVVQFCHRYAVEENHLARVVAQLQQNLIQRVRTRLDMPFVPILVGESDKPASRAVNLEPTSAAVN